MEDQRCPRTRQDTQITRAEAQDDIEFVRFVRAEPNIELAPHARPSERLKDRLVLPEPVADLLGELRTGCGVGNRQIEPGSVRSRPACRHLPATRYR